MNQCSRVIFALSFIILRLILWPFVTYKYFIGAFDIIQKGTAHSPFVVLFVGFASIFLTGLQFYWGSIIIGFLLPIIKTETENVSQKVLDSKKSI